MVKWFDPGDLIVPVGIHDRHVGEDGQGAALWVLGLHEEGVAIGFQARSLIDHPPGPHDPTPPEMELPHLTVEQGEQVSRIPALEGKVGSVGLPLFKLRGVYYVRVSDRNDSVRCSVVMHGNELAIEFTVTDLM